MLVSVVLFPTAAGLFAAGPEQTPAKGSLPQVLLIGDSISIGYTSGVTEILKNEAVITHNKANAEHTGTGLKQLDKWLGTTKWDVIHFNWGLWDLCYRHPDSKVQGNRDKVHGKITTTPEQYEQNLEMLVQRLEKTGAVLIWANTTVVPENEEGRFVGDDKKYNEVAERVMKKHGIPIDDLNTITSGFGPELFEGPGNVHYTKEGYKKLAVLVAGKIRDALQSKAKP